MELRITNPQESWLTEQILWNNEELKAAIAEKVKDYKTIAYTEDSLKDMKADRADLNKLKKAFEDERKRVKKICMEPYTKFEQQVKEITALIDEPIGLIDSQIREIDERRKAAKREEIEELFASIGFQSFVKLDMIWDEKWLNATVTLPKIEEQMKSRMYQIGTDVVTISKLPEFKFEAMEVYRKTLDMNQAIQEGQRLAEGLPTSRKENWKRNAWRQSGKRGKRKKQRSSRPQLNRRKNWQKRKKQHPHLYRKLRKRKQFQFRKRKSRYSSWISVYGEPGSRSWRSVNIWYGIRFDSERWNKIWQ